MTTKSLYIIIKITKYMRCIVFGYIRIAIKISVRYFVIKKVPNEMWEKDIIPNEMGEKHIVQCFFFLFWYKL